jgi:hypothetical protein
MIQIAQCSKFGKQRVNTMRRPSGEYAGWRSMRSRNNHAALCGENQATTSSPPSSQARQTAW